MFLIPQCCCLKNFLRSISVKSLDKTHFTNTKIRGGGGGSVFICLSFGLFYLNVLRLKFNFSLIRICCKYFWLSKHIFSNIVFIINNGQTERRDYLKYHVRSFINFCGTFLHLKETIYIIVTVWFGIKTFHI